MSHTYFTADEASEAAFIAEYARLDPRCRALVLRVMRIASADGGNHDALQAMVDNLTAVAPADKADFIEDWLEVQEAA